jgi:hypothetical protein
LVVTTYTIHLPQDSYSSKSDQGLNIGPTHSPGRREAAELSTKILDQFLEFIMNGQEAISSRNCLINMGLAQPATKMITDNNTVEGIIKGTIKQKRSKSIDMRFYWLKDRQEQGQFDICWESGKTNLADYTTKHHPSSHHKQVRPICLYMKDESPRTLQGCIKILSPNTAQHNARTARTPPFTSSTCPFKLNIIRIQTE